MRSITHQRFLHPAQRPVGRLMKRAAAGDGGRHVTTEDIQQDTLYLSEVVVKGQKQPFRLDFDSGSSDLWVRMLMSMFCHLPNSAIFLLTRVADPVQGIRTRLPASFKAQSLRQGLGLLPYP